MTPKFKQALLNIISVGMSAVRSNAANRGAAGVTLESAYTEALSKLDSSSEDPVISMGAKITSGLLSVGIPRLGKLQRLQLTRTSLFGEDGDGGLFAELKNQLPPSATM